MIYSRQISSLLILLLISLGMSSIKGYNTIYLMEFENIDKDKTIHQFERSLPSLVKENYKFRNDVNISYAADIHPYMDFNVDDPDAIKSLLINGQIFKDGFNLNVSIELYDAITWEILAKRSYYCRETDFICIQDAFILLIEQIVSPYLVDELDPEKIPIVEIIESKREKEIIKSREIRASRQSLLDDIQKNIYKELDNLSAATAQFELNNDTQDQGKFGDRFYKEFNLKSEKSSVYHDSDLINMQLRGILEAFMVNPYDVLIGDLKIDLDKVDPTKIHASVPIEFSIKSALIQDLLTNIPHTKFTNSEGRIHIQFANNEYLFEPSFLDKFSTLRYAVFPVIFFTDKIGRPQVIVVDSKKKRFENIKVPDVPVIRVENIKPMYSITPGKDHLQIILDISSLVATYNMYLPRDIFGDYTKMVVKFMSEDQIYNSLSDNVGIK